LSVRLGGLAGVVLVVLIVVAVAEVVAEDLFFRVVEELVLP
jgi:hypothetical protein